MWKYILDNISLNFVDFGLYGTLSDLIYIYIIYIYIYSCIYMYL